MTVAPGEPIHFAWIQTVSGGTAFLGETNVNGGQIAIDDKGGELLGHPIQYDGEDSLCNAEGGQAAGTKISGIKLSNFFIINYRMNCKWN